MITTVTHYPIPDQAAAKVLGSALRNAGYSEDAIHRLLGEDAYSGDRDEVAVEARRLPATPLATIVRLFFLQLPVSKSDAVRALGPRGVEAIESTGLAEVGATVEPRVRILPIGRVLLASDGYSRDGEDPPDYVATYTPTARVLDSLTPRPEVERALDVGTGSGVQALLAARHTRHVVATDVNERALAYTKLNAALNGLMNIECRQGSLFDPVAGETFDLVVCNAPYVVSPETRWAYRDSEFQADELSERVVGSAAEHLAPGGFASVLVSWLAANESNPDERVLAWAKATGCDSWILTSLNSDPLDHAAEWNSHLAGDAKAYGEALEEWTRYFDRLGVRSVSEGAVLLHRRDGEPTSRIDPIDEDDLDDASDQIERAFEARAWLARLGKSSELLSERLALAMPLRLERELEPEDGATVITDERVELSEGTKHAVDTTEEALEVLTSLNGQPLGDIVQEVADRLQLTEAETIRLSREAVSLTRELLELGALRVR